MIRRITPWPVALPIQVFPVAVPPAARGGTPTTGSTDYTEPDYAYIRSVEIIYIDYWARPAENRCVDYRHRIRIGSYASGELVWQGAVPAEVPAFMGFSTDSHGTHCHPPGACRGVGMRWHDREGAVATTVKRY